jgi:hypothetical protein
MGLEFSEDLFNLSEGQNQEDEGQNAGSLHVYSNEKYGSVQAFVTEEEHEADFEEFEKEFEAEIDKVIKFAEQHGEAAGDDSDAPHLSPEQEESIIQNLQDFKRRLFTFDASGMNVAYDESINFVYANGRSTFFDLSKLLHNDKVPLQTRLNALENLGEKLTVCSGGVVDAMYDEIGKLNAALHGAKGLMANLTQEIARQEILEFVRFRHENNPSYSPMMEVHFVNYYFNELAKPADPSQSYDWLTKPFAWPVHVDPDYANANSTGVLEEDLEACYAVLREKIQPGLVVRRASEQYLQEIKDMVRDSAKDSLSTRVETATKYMQGQYGQINTNSLITYDEDSYEMVWRPTSALIAVEMLKALAERKLITGDKPKALAGATPSLEEERQRDLMQWERLFWIREWFSAPKENSDPDKSSDPVPLRVAHLALFLPEDVQAVLAGSQEKAARVLQDIVQEAIAGVGVEEMLNIPDAWLQQAPLTALFQTLQPGDPKRGADAEQWAALFKKAIDAGADIEEENAQGQTPLLAAAEQGLIHAFTALVDAGANIQAQDNSGCNALLLWLVKGRDNIVGEQRAALFESAIAKCASIVEQQNSWGQTPLLAAANWGLPDAYTALVDMGANLRAIDVHNENVVGLWLAWGQDDLAMRAITQIRGDGPFTQDMVELFDLQNGRIYDAALKNNCPKAMRELNKCLIDAVESGWLTKEQVSRIVINSKDGRRAALEQNGAAAFEADARFLIHAMENGLLNKAAFKEIARSCVIALDQGRTTAVEAYNKLFLQAREENQLNNAQLKKLLKTSDKQRSEMPHDSGQEAALRAHCQAVLKCYRNGWLSGKDLKKQKPTGWLEDNFGSQYSAAKEARKQDSKKYRLPRPLKGLMSCFSGASPMQSAQIQAPQPDTDVNIDFNPGDLSRLNFTRDQQRELVSPSSEGFELEGKQETDDVDIHAVDNEAEAPGQAAIDASRKDKNVVQSETQREDGASTSAQKTMLEEDALDFTHPQAMALQPVALRSVAAQGALTKEMNRLGFHLHFSNATDPTPTLKSVRGFNDCGLQALLRVDRNLQKAWLKRDVDPRGWDESLEVLKNQLERTAAGDRIEYAGITDDHLTRLFEARGIDAGNVMQKVTERGLEDVLKEAHKEGETFVLVTGVSRVNIGEYEVRQKHFVTLVPPRKPDEAADQPRPEDSSQQIWRLSDPNPETPNAPRYVEVTTRQIAEALDVELMRQQGAAPLEEGKWYALICVPNAPTHYEQVEQIARESQDQRYLRQQVMPDASVQKPSSVNEQQVPENLEARRKSLEDGDAQDDEELHNAAPDMPPTEPRTLEPTEIHQMTSEPAAMPTPIKAPEDKSLRGVIRKITKTGPTEHWPLGQPQMGGRFLTDQEREELAHEYLNKKDASRVVAELHDAITVDVTQIHIREKGNQKTALIKYGQKGDERLVVAPEERLQRDGNEKHVNVLETINQQKRNSVNRPTHSYKVTIPAPTPERIKELCTEAQIKQMKERKALGSRFDSRSGEGSSRQKGTGGK